MSKPGWLSIRNLPFLKDNSSVSNVYYTELKEFFETYTTCPDCDGRGFNISKKQQYVKSSEVCSVRLQGIEELEKLNDMEDVVTAEVIRDILEQRLWDKEHCENCLGSRFVKRKKLKLKRVS